MDCLEGWRFSLLQPAVSKIILQYVTDFLFEISFDTFFRVTALLQSQIAFHLRQKI